MERIGRGDNDRQEAKEEAAGERGRAHSALR